MLLKENTFLKKKYNKLLVSTLLSCFIVVFAEMFDSFAAGKYVDGNAVIAIELITPLEYIGFAVAMLLTYGIGAIYNKEKGNQNTIKSYQIAGMGLFIAISGAILLFILKNLFIDDILKFYKCSKEVFDYAVYYSRIQSIYLVPLFVFYYLNIMVLADGNEKMTIIVNTISSLLAIFLPNILAANFGLKGIALTMPISYFIGVLILSTHFLSKRNSIRFKWYFSFDSLKELISISSAYSLLNIYVAINDIIFNSVIIDHFSNDHLLAYAVINFTINLGEVLSVSLMAARSFISVSDGEKNSFYIKRATLLSFKYGIVIAIVFGGLLMSLANYWPIVLDITNVEVKQLAIYAGIVIPSTYIFVMVVYSFMEYYPIMNKPLYANALSIIYMLIAPLTVCLPLAYLSDFKAVIIGFALTPVVTVLVFVLYFVITKKEGAPLFIPSTDEKELIYCLKTNIEDIQELNNRIINDLSGKFNENLVEEVSRVINNSLMIISKNNKKCVYVEVVLLYNENNIRLFIKDNGRIFNLIEELNDSYNCIKENDIVMSFNSNVYVWNLK